MGIQHYPVQFRPTAPLVDQYGVPLTGYGRAFFLGLYNRTGQGNGIIPSVTPAPGLTATGSSIADALALTDDWNDIEAGDNNTGVIIAAALKLAPGNDIWVFNGTGNNKNVYPPDANSQIDALGAGNPFALGSGKLRCFQCWGVTALGTGTSSQFRSYGN